jgi:hypothetical protein
VTTPQVRVAPRPHTRQPANTEQTEACTDFESLASSEADELDGVPWDDYEEVRVLRCIHPTLYAHIIKRMNVMLRAGRLVSQLRPDN